MSIEAMKQALEALENNRQTHHYCEDTWYSCPKHEDGCANDSEGDECNCGADKANAEIDVAITSLRQTIAEAEKHEVSQEPVAMKRQLVKIHDALSAHLGDTDPYIPEDMTDDEVCEYEPVFWAAKEIAALIGDAPWSNYTHPQPKQEPVAIPEGFSLIAVKGFDELMYWIDRCERKGHLENCPDLIEPYEAFDYRTIDTHQQLKREWAGLTDEEVADIERNSITRRQAIRAIEAKLKAKNFA